MNVGCLVVPRFPLACELMDRPDLRGHAVVVARPDRPVVWSASPEAEIYGVVMEQPLCEALQRYPAVEVIEGHPAHYRRVEEHIIECLERHAPGIDNFADGVFLLDLAGLPDDHHARLRRWEALHTSAPADLDARLGLANDRFTAEVAALQAGPGGLRVVPDEQRSEFLHPQQVSVLPIPLDMQRRLEMLGLRTVGDVVALPRRAIVAQFGLEGMRMLSVVHGSDVEPIRTRRHRERLRESMTVSLPLTDRLALQAIVQQLVGQINRNPRMRGRAARQGVLRMESERGHCWDRVLTFREPLVGVRALWPLFRTAVEQIQPTAPVSTVDVELCELVAARGQQCSLSVGRSRERERLEEGLRRLRVQYGHCPVARVVKVEPWSRIPERRLALIDYAV